MVSPAPGATPAINICGPYTDKQFAEIKEFLRPALPPANAADLAPKTSCSIEKNTHKLSKFPQLAKFLKFMLDAFKNLLRIVAYPTLAVGAIMLSFGLAQTIFILATTFSVALLLESQALVVLMLGGILYKVGQDIIENNDLNTVMGNLLYIPLPFLLRLAK